VKGLTLIEMIIALSLVAMICLIAVPSFRQQAIHATNNIAQAQLLQQLQQAQQIANAKAISVTVCLSRDGKACVADNGTMVLSFADNHLFSSAYLKGDGVLHLRAYPIYRNYIIVQPAIINKSDNGTFWYCDKDHVLQWAVSVSQYGEPHFVAKSYQQLVC
jgi:type IV fimbrial biogenesis protein FimT